MQVDAPTLSAADDTRPSSAITWKIIALMTALAVAIRIASLSRPGYLAGITEFDDGVYLGGAIRLTQGLLPYRDFAFVQPPGILLLMTPVALAAKLTTTIKAMALARVLSALASAACVPLAGNLVRHRGPLAVLVASGLLAVYPSDVLTARTLMLEPWMNLGCLLAATAGFRQGTLASPRRLAVAGLAFGFAGTIKFWAAAPAAVVFAMCLIAGSGPDGSRRPRLRRLRAYAPGLVAGFGVPVLPFLLSAPGAFLQGTITDQATRAGTAVPLAVRLAYETGTIDILSSHGWISLLAGGGSMFAAGTSNVNLSYGIGWLPYAAAAGIAAGIAAGYAARCRAEEPGERPSHLEWTALATGALAVTAVLGYSAFFYHYAGFPAPWLALAAGSAVAALFSRVGRAAGAGLARIGGDEPRARNAVLALTAAAIVLVGGFQSWEAHGSTAPTAGAAASLIPEGSCLVTDEASLAIAADRFTRRPPGCPVIVDSLASTLVLSHGVSVQGGAGRLPAVVGQWKEWLGQADYVWLSPGRASARRIPWTPGLRAWFDASFRPVGRYSPGTGQIYQRVR